MEEDIKKIINDIKSFQEEQKVKHSDNEEKMEQNKLKIDDIKKEIAQNKSMQKSFEEEEPEYKELSDKIEEQQKGINDLETENIYLNNENMRIRSGKANKEKEKEIETRKQELKSQINQERRFLIKNRNMSKEDISKKISEIQEQQKFLKSDIEAGKRGIEIEKKVAEQTGYQDALEFKKKMLANREEDYANNESKAQDYMNLLKIDDVFEEINRLDLEMNEIDKISMENINIDMNIFKSKQEDEKYIQDWDEAIKENERRDQEAKYVQDWDEAIKENERRDKEAKYVQDWDEAIKENERRDQEEKNTLDLGEFEEFEKIIEEIERRDQEAKYVRDWDEAIKENERRDKEKEHSQDGTIKGNEGRTQEDRRENYSTMRNIEIKRAAEVAKASVEKYAIEKGFKDVQDFKNNFNSIANVVFGNILELIDRAKIEKDEQKLNGIISELDNFDVEKEIQEIVRNDLATAKILLRHTDNQQEQSIYEDEIKRIENAAERLGIKLERENSSRAVPDDNSDKKSKITNIYISEASGKVSIMKDGKNQDSPYSLGFLINSGKENLDSKTYKEICKGIAGSTLKGWLLRRKINPVVFEVLKDNATPKEIEEYIDAIQNKNEFDFSLTHDLRNTQLKGKERRIMRRAARTEQKLEEDNLSVSVLKDSKPKLLGRGKRKLKNSPTTIERAKQYIAKFKGKAVPTIGRKIDDARKQFEKKLKINVGPIKDYNNDREHNNREQNDIEHVEIDEIIDAEDNDVMSL